MFLASVESWTLKVERWTLMQLRPQTRQYYRPAARGLTSNVQRSTFNVQLNGRKALLRYTPGASWVRGWFIWILFALVWSGPILAADKSAVGPNAISIPKGPGS